MFRLVVMPYFDIGLCSSSHVNNKIIIIIINFFNFFIRVFLFLSLFFFPVMYIVELYSHDCSCVLCACVYIAVALIVLSRSSHCHETNTVDSQYYEYISYEISAVYMNALVIPSHFKVCMRSKPVRSSPLY